MQGGDEMRRTAIPKLTYDDFLCFPDDGRRHELIDGEHFVTPSPATVHQRLVRRLLVALDGYFRQTSSGEVFNAPFDVVLGHQNVVEPDLLVVLKDQQDILTEQHVRGAPAIVVEILSPGTRACDETLKRDLYARAGVREYWMVDPDARAIRVCRWPAAGQPGPVTDLAAAAGDALTSPLLPGFALEVAGLFAESARRG
jgi:Uma2 family endonuclease